jgi:hypothetical protein
MPRLSAFTPLGLLRLSGAPCDSEVYFRNLRANQGGDAVVAKDGWQDARLYAEGMTLARAKRAAEAAFEQSLPRRTTTHLEEREREHGLPVSTSLSDVARRTRLYDLRRLPTAPTSAEVTARMTEIWGVDLVSVTAPTFAAQGSNGERWGDVAIPRVVEVIGESTVPGTPATILARLRLGPPPEVGDSYTFAPMSPSVVFPGDVVAVSAVGGADYNLTVRTLSQPLPKGVLGRTGTYSGRRSSAGVVRVTVASTAYADSTRRARTEVYLNSNVRGSHDWQLVPSNVAVFQVGTGRVGIDRIGAL